MPQQMIGMFWKSITSRTTWIDHNFSRCKMIPWRKNGMNNFPQKKKKKTRKLILLWTLRCHNFLNNLELPHGCPSLLSITSFKARKYITRIVMWNEPIINLPTEPSLFYTYLKTSFDGFLQVFLFIYLFWDSKYFYWLVSKSMLYIQEHKIWHKTISSGKKAGYRVVWAYDLKT